MQSKEQHALKVRSPAEGWNFILVKLHNIFVLGGWGGGEGGGRGQTPRYHYVTIIEYCRMNAPAKAYGFPPLRALDISSS